ncbi:hypothetical protein RB595_006095 [Gaeumannomyces hyphopodioides]
METDVSVETTPPSGEAAKDSYSGNEDRSIYRARACLRCSRSKLRCMRTADPSVKPCVRCARLGAECTIPEAKPRGPRRGQGRRVGQLEQKLDGIMSLLTASKHLNEQRQSKPNSTSPTSAVIGESRQEPFARVFPPGPGLLNSATSYSPTVQEYVPADTPESLSHRTGTDTSPKATPPERTVISAPDPVKALDEELQPQRYEIFSGLELNDHEARTALDNYRSVYQPNFPFVPVSRKTSPGALFAKSPLVFRAIMISCAHQSHSVQRDGDRWFRSHIAQRVVVNGEKNLELLQSIIVFLAWCDYRFFINSQGTSLLQLALGVVMELGFNKPPIASYTQKQDAMIYEAFRKVPGFSIRSSFSREDMRAMLGAFYCASLRATLFRREHYLPYTDFIDRCCTTLLETEEYQTDRALVTMIRMQCLVRRAQALLPGAYPCPDTAVTFTPPVAISLAALRREMDETATGLHPRGTGNTHFLRLHYYASMVAMQEPAIYTRSTLPPSAPIFPQGPTSVQGLKRVDALWNCLRSVNDYVDTYLEVPAELVGLQPLASTALLTFSLVTATRMLFIQDADWDALNARRIFDFPGIMTRLANLFAAGQAFEAARGTSASGTYRRRFQDDACTPILKSYVAKLLWLRQWYMARTAPPGHNVAPPGEDPLPGDISPKPPGEEEEEDLQQVSHAELQPQKQSGAPPGPPKGAQFLGDPASGLALEPPNADSLGFDVSYLDTFDDSFWHAFMMDPQMVVPPMNMQIDPMT